jgi:hypothetical protein
MNRSTEEADSGQVDANVVRRLLQHVPLTVTQTVLVTRGPLVLAVRGVLKPVEAADVAVYVAEGWRDTEQTLRIQFMPLPLSPDARLLLSYPLRGGTQLTLVDAEGAPLEQLRRLGGQLLAVLAAAGMGR